ncbi:hypothetical protein M3M33_16355, partial [Loigolactobacillus coryniformis]|uniref:hypothetical protein n=1 Tax=Loigolactobacillus coryniformis TaxID=1610 RepID=UPI00201A8110
IINNNVDNRGEAFNNEFREINQPYLKKYDITICISTLDELEKLSKQDLNNFYLQIKQLVQKPFTINELGINKPAINLNNLS